MQLGDTVIWVTSREEGEVQSFFIGEVMGHDEETLTVLVRPTFECNRVYSSDVLPLSPGQLQGFFMQR